jgi:hypothetical protein
MILVLRQSHGIQGGSLVLAHAIGKAAGRATGILRSAGLTPFRQILDPDCFARAWARPLPPNAVLIPEIVFWLMATVALGEPCMAASVVRLWSGLRASMPHLPIRPVTEEAFSLARSALPLRFFLPVFDDIVNRFSQRFSDRFRWNHHRLLGLDGMDTDLPPHPHLRRIFPPPSNEHGPAFVPQARLVGLVGLWDGLCYGFRWTSLQVSEQDSARRLFDALLGPGDLVMCDRNFPDFETFAHILHHQADFLFHLPSNRFLGYDRIPTPSGRSAEWYVHLPWPKDLRRCYPELGPILRARIMQYQWPGYETSWLITSLPDLQPYPYCELVPMYHQRWRQETFHREWKYSLQLSNLRCHTASGLLKEVLVQLTMNNAVRWIMAQAAKPNDRPVDLKFLEAKRLILSQVPAMTTARACLLPWLYQQLLDTIAAERILVRPGRNYPRKWDERVRPKGHGKVARPARILPS